MNYVCLRSSQINNTTFCTALLQAYNCIAFEVRTCSLISNACSELKLLKRAIKLFSCIFLGKVQLGHYFKTVAIMNLTEQNIIEFLNNHVCHHPRQLFVIGTRTSDAHHVVADPRVTLLTNSGEAEGYEELRTTN